MAKNSVIHEWDGLYQSKVASSASKKRSKKSTISYPEFIACGDYINTLLSRDNREAWAKYFYDCGNGILPAGFTIIGSTICFSLSRKKPSVSLTTETAELCEKLIKFFVTYDKCLVISEKVSTRAKKKNLYTDMTTMKWSDVRKKCVKKALIFDYIDRTYKENEWNKSFIDQVYTKTIKYLEIYGLDARHVDFQNGEIKDMSCIKLTEGDVELRITRQYPPIDPGYCADLNERTNVYETTGSSSAALADDGEAYE